MTGDGIDISTGRDYGHSENGAWSPGGFTLEDTDRAAILTGLYAWSSDLIGFVRPDGRILAMGPSAQRFLGYSEAQLCGTNILDLVPPDARSEFQSYLIRHADPLEPQRTDSPGWTCAFIDECGQHLRLYHRAIPLENGILLLISQATHEPSDPRTTETGSGEPDGKTLAQRLTESEQKYRTLVESAGEAIAVVNEGGCFLFMNNVAAQRLGGDPDQFIGQTMWDLFPEPVAERQMAAVRKVLATQTGKNVTSQTQVSGRLRWYNTTVVPLQERPGEDTEKVLIIGRDIDKLKRAEQEVAHYREEMIRAEHLASLGTLSATAAHELNQPLTVIRLSLENALAALTDRPGDSKAIGEMLQEALDEMDNASGIVTRFRSFAQRSSDRQVSVVYLQDTVGRVVDLIQRCARQKHVRIELTKPGERIPLHCDRNALSQIFFSLLQNSIQAADGRKDHLVEIKIENSSKIAEIMIVDDCGGIPPQQLNRVFEPFYTTKPDGTGLGLCLVRRLIEEMGGQIRVKSQWGGGSQFLLTLPVMTAVRK